ncbi:pseudouridine synthase [Candidatus Xianfuyuplasma coldseepsis]|uniref:Pseudouridine synthase n=1 Tax=Candidatus Xianfuyuplasma coldseepsis TaxID=2782163 RepID=A0A7L7KTT4_9MOLU|nr:pseudouridine synthase [Xianfuyuplasma coldseepsis]QMS85666.1 rRNA pseudouridine synthase [Xianfuyuplasma coldseepsis]
MERLQKVIAHSGYCSRRKAEELIVAGNVFVNGEKVTELGTKVSSSDDIVINGQALSKEDLVYYVLYKPEGYVSTTSDEKNRRTVLDLVPSDKRVYPVGRLDYDTSGVLLITNDGTFTNQMTSPHKGIEKEYVAKVEGFVRKNESAQLRRGIEIDGYKTKPAFVKNVTYTKKNETSIVTLIITEGKYHQVKKMFEAIGHPVLSLKRTRFGMVTVEGMKKGEIRRLKPYELKQLKEQVKS